MGQQALLSLGNQHFWCRADPPGIQPVRAEAVDSQQMSLELTARSDHTSRSGSLHEKDRGKADASSKRWVL